MHETDFLNPDGFGTTMTREEYYRKHGDREVVKVVPHKGTICVENNPNIVVRDTTKSPAREKY